MDRRVEGLPLSLVMHGGLLFAETKP